MRVCFTFDILYVGKIFCETFKHAATGHGTLLFAPLRRRRKAHNIHVAAEMKPPPYNIIKHYHKVDDYVSTAKIESHVLTSCAMVAKESTGHV